MTLSWIMRTDVAQKLSEALEAIGDQFMAIEHGKSEKHIHTLQSIIADARVALLKQEVGLPEKQLCESCGNPCMKRFAVISSTGTGLSVCEPCLVELLKIGWSKL